MNKGILIQTTAEKSAKLKAKARELGIVPASARVLIELALFGVSVSNPSYTMDSETRTAVLKMCNQKSKKK